MSGWSDRPRLIGLESVETWDEICVVADEADMAAVAAAGWKQIVAFDGSVPVAIVVRPGVAEKTAMRTANGCARGGNDVGVLKLFAHFGSPQLRTGLPVCIMPMMRSCVFGCSSSAQKRSRSRAIRSR